MTSHAPLPPIVALLDDIRQALGDAAVLVGDDIPARNLCDASTYPACRPRALILPTTTEHVSAALRICHDHGQAVTVQGGLTGLAGGAVAAADEVAISTERLTGIAEVDRSAMTLTALAGTSLADVQQAAESHGLVYGIDLGARGTCTIGGNVATNAGGNRVIHYGMTRHNILGLEVVLADGSVVESRGKMLKNNTGYDWPQLMAGSEGTLGIITCVTVRLFPAPRNVLTVALAIRDFDRTLDVLHALQEAYPRQLLSFEVMWREFQYLAQRLCGLQLPFPDLPDVLALLEISRNDLLASSDEIEDSLSGMIDKGWIADAVVASSKAQVDRLWQLREASSQYRGLGFHVIGYDISFPTSSIAAAVEHLRQEFRVYEADVPAYCFGHAADGCPSSDALSQTGVLISGAFGSSTG